MYANILVTCMARSYKMARRYPKGHPTDDASTPVACTTLAIRLKWPIFRPSSFRSGGWKKLRVDCQLIGHNGHFIGIRNSSGLL